MYNQKSGLIWKSYLRNDNYITIEEGHVKFQLRFLDDIAKRIKLLRTSFLYKGNKIKQEKLNLRDKGRISLIENKKKPIGLKDYLTSDLMFEIVNFYLENEKRITYNYQSVLECDHCKICDDCIDNKLEKFKMTSDCTNCVFCDDHRHINYFPEFKQKKTLEFWIIFGNYDDIESALYDLFKALVYESLDLFFNFTKNEEKSKTVKLESNQNQLIDLMSFNSDFSYYIWDLKINSIDLLDSDQSSKYQNLLNKSIRHTWQKIHLDILTSFVETVTSDPYFINETISSLNIEKIANNWVENEFYKIIEKITKDESRDRISNIGKIVFNIMNELFTKAYDDKKSTVSNIETLETLSKADRYIIDTANQLRTLQNQYLDHLLLVELEESIAESVPMSEDEMLELLNDKSNNY